MSFKQTGALKEGDFAPDFTLPSSSGGEVRLGGLRGKKVVLYFYPEDDTAGCTREACSFRDNMPNFDKLDATILGVSKDSLESHHRFISKYGLNFALLSDEKLEAHKLYDTWREKENYGRKYWGTERSTFVIGKDCENLSEGPGRRAREGCASGPLILTPG